MTVTFLVSINLDDLSTIADVAADIQDDLISAGHDVEEVKPWQRPTLTGAQPIPPATPIQPI